MMKVGSSDWLNIVTLTDREKGPAALHYVEKGELPNWLQETVASLLRDPRRK